MPDREKVIKGLECCIGYGIEDTPGCEDCPYNDMGDTCERMRPLYEDALALLKAQEPVPPAQDGCGALICGNQTLGCGVVGMYDVETGRVTEKISNYCAFCGRKVKWE